MADRVDTTIGVDLSTAKKIRELANEQDRTIASMVRLILRNYLSPKVREKEELTKLV